MTCGDAAIVGRPGVAPTDDPDDGIEHGHEPDGENNLRQEEADDAQANGQHEPGHALVLSTVMMTS
jgi:hypothetical protein